jgi:hypothetical protein
MTTNTDWVKRARPKKGALHRQLHFPVNQPIPYDLLTTIVKASIGDTIVLKINGREREIPVTPLLKKRANFARNVAKR